jgi:hypothetical protein
MAEVALGHIRVLDTRDSLGDHLEMAHVVAGRCAMALSTIRRARRRMAVLREGPGTRAVTAAAVTPELSRVSILAIVASIAVEKPLPRRWRLQGVLRTKCLISQSVCEEMRVQQAPLAVLWRARE